MAKTVADYMLERLHAWDIRRIYGYPGDGINGIVGALDRKSDLIDFIQVRHEEMAAFMATGHAKYSGEVGVCLATSGPGAIHLLNGLYDGKLDNQPVVAIVGQQKSMALGGDYQQEVDLQVLFKDVAADYVHTVMNPVQMRHIIDRAVRIAKAERTVTCIIVPADVQEQDAVEKPPRIHGSIHSGIGHVTPSIVPKQADLERAAAVLNEGDKVAMLVGAGALGATREVEEMAEVLGAGVAKALLGKAVISDELPYCTGPIGLLGSKPSWDLMSDCDTLLMVGSNFPYSEFLPKEGAARAIQIDINPRRLSIRYPMEVNLMGDSAETLRALMPLVKRKEDRSWRETVEKNVAEWWDTLEKRAHEKADPINPQLVFWELSKRLPDNCILAADSGSVANWYARDLKVKPSMMATLSGGLATMGPGVPYAVAAKFAHPDRPVIAMVGDGAMQMNGLNELITIAKYRERWANQTLIVMVLNNHDLNQVTWEQRALAGDPKFLGSQQVPEFAYARYAELIGLKGIRVESPEQIGPAWDEAFAADRPVVLDVRTDPEVPPLPPHITVSQATSYAKAIWKGDPEAFGIVKKSTKDFMDQIFGRS